MVLQTCYCCGKWTEDNKCDVNHLCERALKDDWWCANYEAPKSVTFQIKKLISTVSKLEAEVKEIRDELSRKV